MKIQFEKRVSSTTKIKVSLLVKRQSKTQFHKTKTIRRRLSSPSFEPLTPHNTNQFLIQNSPAAPFQFSEKEYGSMLGVFNGNSEVLSGKFGRNQLIHRARSLSDTSELLRIVEILNSEVAEKEKQIQLFNELTN